jgi:rhodanese-related sulfurtransferase
MWRDLEGQRRWPSFFFKLPQTHFGRAMLLVACNMWNGINTDAVRGVAVGPLVRVVGSYIAFDPMGLESGALPHPRHHHGYRKAVRLRARVRLRPGGIRLKAGSPRVSTSPTSKITAIAAQDLFYCGLEIVVAQSAENAAKIAEGIFVGLEQLASRARELLPDPAAEIAVYCGKFTWTRAQEAVASLHELGYSNVRDYRGGIADWVESGAPTESVTGVDYRMDESLPFLAQALSGW